MWHNLPFSESHDNGLETFRSVPLANEVKASHGRDGLPMATGKNMSQRELRTFQHIGPWTGDYLVWS